MSPGIPRDPAGRLLERRIHGAKRFDPMITLDEDEKWSTMWSDLFLKGQRVQRDVA